MAGTRTDKTTRPSTENPPEQVQPTLDNRPHSLWWYSWRRLKRNKLAMVGLWLVVFLTFVALFADFLAPMNPNRQALDYSLKPALFTGNALVFASVGEAYREEIIPIFSFSIRGDTIHYVDNLERSFARPVSELVGEDESEWHIEPTYLLGTDHLGRDVLSRLIHGARVSMAVGFMAQIISLTIGVMLGALAGFFRGKVDALVMYVANVVWSFPFILLVIAFSLVIGQGLMQTFIAIGVVNWVDTCRIVRGQFFTLRETEYIEATRAVGFGSTRTILRHLMPNALGPITVIATAGFAYAIIAEASLSYIGIGVEFPQASWGQMINDGYGHITAGRHWELALYPSVAIALAVFGFNMLGDGLRDAIDPKLKR